MTTRVPEEASAGMRQMARMLRDMFVALRQEGFTRDEAVAIIGQTVQASMLSEKAKGDDDD
jgi:hypothetical protein